jgi:excisionase family DNA binding protein
MSRKKVTAAWAWPDLSRRGVLSSSAVISRLGHFGRCDDSRGDDAMIDVLMTKAEAAKRLRVSTRTIDRLRMKKQLAWVPVGSQIRFRGADLDSFIASQTRGMKG